MLRFSLIIVFVALAVAAASDVNRQFRVSIYLERNEDLEALNKAFRRHPGYEVLSKNKNEDKGEVQEFVMVHKDLYSELTNYLKKNNIKYQYKIENIFVPRKPESVQRKPIKSHIFLNYDEIEGYLETLATIYHEIVDMFSIGKSVENRHIFGVKLSIKDGKKRQAVFIEAGAHANEWITTSSAIYMITQLLERENIHILKQADFYVIPTINPDGYTFALKNYEPWKKNRGPTEYKTKSSPLPKCIGVDLDRNFDYAWTDVENEYCSPTHSGSSPFSEPETRNLRNFIIEKRNTIAIYLSLHNNDNRIMILYPWAHSLGFVVNVHQLNRVAYAASGKGPCCDYIGSYAAFLGPIGGTSLDWVYGKAGIKLTYRLNLHHRTPWRLDMELSESLKVGNDTFQIISSIANHANPQISDNQYYFHNS